MEKDKTWSRDEFLQWAKRTLEMFRRDGPVCTVSRMHADRVRQHDPALADLYLESARVNEAIRDHLVSRMDGR